MVFLVDSCPFAQHKRARQNRKNKRKNKRKSDGSVDTSEDESDDDYLAPEPRKTQEQERQEKQESETTDQTAKPEAAPQPDSEPEVVKEPEPEVVAEPVKEQEEEKRKKPKEKKAIKDLAKQDNGQTYEDCMSGFEGNYIPKTYLTSKFGKTELTDYQVQLLNVLQYRRRALAWWRTGAGKTRVGVTAAADFRQKFPNGRILVVCVKITKPAWVMGVAKVLDYEWKETTNPTQVEKQIENFEKAKNLKFYDVGLSNKDFQTAENIASKVIDVNSPTMLIFDEVQKGILQGSTTTSRFFNVLDKLRQNSDNRFLALSATPFKVDAQLIYVALSFLIFGTTMDSEIKESYPFGGQLLDAINKFRTYSENQPKAERGVTPPELSDLYDAAKKSHVSTCMFNCYFEEGNAFPKFTVTQLCVLLSDDCFDAFWSSSDKYEYINWADNCFQRKTRKEPTFSNPNLDDEPKDETYENTCFLVKSMKDEFQQDNQEFQNYKTWFKDSKDGKPSQQLVDGKIDIEQTKSLISPKMYWLALKLNQENTGRFVVFFVSKVSLRVFTKMLEKKQMDTKYIDGSITTSERGEIQEWYNGPQKPTDKKILLLNISAGGTGLDLKWTTALYFMQMDFSPVEFYQAVGRGVRRESHGKKSDNETVEVYVISQKTEGEAGRVTLNFKDDRFSSVKTKTEQMMAMIRKEQRYCIGNPEGVEGLIKTSKKWADQDKIKQVNCPP